MDRVDARNFLGRLASEVALISKKALAGTYEYTKYREKLVSRGADKAPRQLAIPTIRDRVTLRALCDYLFDIYPEARPDLPQGKIDALKAAVDSGKYPHFIRIDLRDFYPSLNHSIVLSRARRRARLPAFRKLVANALMNPTVAENAVNNASTRTKGVPQGLSISNVLAEIFMLEVDARIKSLAPVYIRYVDDIIILTDVDPGPLCKEVFGILRASKLSPHPINEPGSKSHIGLTAAGFTYLGYSVEPTRISVKATNVLAFEGSLVETFVEYRHRLRTAVTVLERDAARARFRWNLNLKLTGCIYKGQRFGWVFYYSQINDPTVLHRIDNTVRLLFNRFKIAVPPNPKRAVKAYFEAKRTDKATHRYIPNYDLLTVPAVRTFLSEIGVNVAGLPDDEVLIAFNRIIGRATHKLQKDVSSMS
ncbi:reverse transcriptase domain-containing protein [Ramlibacter sp.]|uniref:reverse transcriptase domain-containing protein n=1 Tax=Ramlibacter sp. TaxID=1917967 RepID=UPI00263A038B|nr:reverse transcriptase domain-containing protein [Ramlibacter sp.]